MKTVDSEASRNVGSHGLKEVNCEKKCSSCGIAVPSAVMLSAIDGRSAAANTFPLSVLGLGERGVEGPSRELRVSREKDKKVWVVWNHPLQGSRRHKRVLGAGGSCANACSYPRANARADACSYPYSFVNCYRYSSPKAPTHPVISCFLAGTASGDMHRECRCSHRWFPLSCNALQTLSTPNTPPLYPRWGPHYILSKNAEARFKNHRCHPDSDRYCLRSFIRVNLFISPKLI